MGILLDKRKRVETRGCAAFAAVHNGAQFRLAAQQVKGDYCALHKKFMQRANSRSAQALGVSAI
jgi:hypothetical protein